MIKETKEVKKVESQLSNDGGSKTIVLTEEDAKEAVKNRFADITSVDAILTKDNGLFEYEVSFKGDNFYGDADVNAESGVILDSVVKYGTVVTIPADSSKKTELLSYEEAKEAVIKEAGGGTVRDMDLDKENGEYFYEVELHIDGMERDYIVNAKTGEECQRRWGITPLQIFLHKDEGHWLNGQPEAEDKESFQIGGRWFKPNYHAHIVFDWMNHETGKSRKLNDEDMATMQTLAFQITFA